MMAGRE